jgi:hypothetical protein
MLNLIEQKAVDEFKNFLLNNYSNRIELIELFGSKARGIHIKNQILTC